MGRWGRCDPTQSYIGRGRKRGEHRATIERYYGWARERSLRVICDVQVDWVVQLQRLIPTISAMVLLREIVLERREIRINQIAGK
jgi:hypothetical protein